MGGEGDWKCPECPYNSRNKTQLEKHIKTIAHTGINVKSETVKEDFSEHSEQKENGPDNNSEQSVSSEDKIYNSEADIVQSGTKTKINANKLERGEKSKSVQKCRNCPYFSGSEKQFTRHQETHHSANVHKCEQCGSSFTGKRVLASHIKVVHLLEGFNCTFCDTILRTSKKLNSHMKVKHLAKDKQLKPSKRYERKFKIHKCDVCDYSCYNSNSLARHIESKHDSTMNPCDECEKEFKVKQEMVVHKRNVHGGGYVCTFCNFTCAVGSDIKLHRRKEHPELLFGGRLKKEMICKAEIKFEPDTKEENTKEENTEKENTKEENTKEENKDFDPKVKLESWHNLRSGFLEGTEIQNGVKLKQRMKLGMKIDSEVSTNFPLS